MRTLEDIQTWRGMTAVDADGDNVGKIDEVYLDRSSGEPEWVTVNTGLFGTKTSFAPISGAEQVDDQIRLAYSKADIKNAPSVDADGELSSEEERALYDHYGRGDYGDWDGETDRTEGLFDQERSGRGGRFSRQDGTTGRDTSGPNTDDAMTRSEEELRVGTERREAGRARLRKYVVTEQVTKTVPVQREELRIEREPITDANRDAAVDGPGISEEEHEVVLHEEVPVVEKQTVPQERVRLAKDTRTDEESVTQDVRKERIETEGDTGSKR
jgi:uncharacterized protein (TIGR02271 family)